MEAIDKVVRIGRNGSGDIFCHIQFHGGRLSISGVEGPTRDGNCCGSCGQIVMSLKDEVNSIQPAQGWDTGMLSRFMTCWDQWHLNDMKAGTPAQTAFLETRKGEFPGYPVSHYDWASKILADAGLNPDNGYKYGSAWLTVAVPADVLAFLESLPETDKKPAWV